jgi:hypothetical protein
MAKDIKKVVAAPVVGDLGKAETGVSGASADLGLKESDAVKQRRTKLQERQTKELNKLNEQEARRTGILTKKRRGRASLISGSERGAEQETLG